MASSAKINRLAMASFASGLVVIALLSFGLYWLLFPMAFPSPPGYYNTIRTSLDLSVSVQYLCAAAALLAGILALREIKKKDGTEKGKLLAWVGLVLGAGYILFGLLVGITFSLAEILH